MAQAPCENSLRPDWLGVSFKSTTERHQQQVWDLIQHHIARVTDDQDWEVGSASRHFERCFRHEIGARFEISSLQAERNAGLAVLNLSGMYWALSSVYEQMRLLSHIHQFKGRFHYTRLDAQVTTLNPSQTAEQICTDVAERRLWIKGYQGWEQKGIRDLDGNVINGASACFGAATSNRRATSYNKSAEQLWDVPARRDEARLRGDWAEQHTTAIATAIAGASSEDAAITAYTEATSATIAQHMQYLDITGTPIPKPKDWARGKKAPKWWSETLDQEITPVKLNRKPERDCFARFAFMRMQWGPTWAECCADLVAKGRAPSVEQASFDLAQRMLSVLRPEHLQKASELLPEAEREAFITEMLAAGDRASIHTEMAGDPALDLPCE